MLKSFGRLYTLSFKQPRSFYFSTTKSSKPPRDYSKLTYYEILSISPNATQKQLKAKYYELAKQYHPDTYKGTDTEFFKHIQRAYETLKNPSKRKEYDMKNNLGFQRESYTSSPDKDEPTGAGSETRKKGHFEDIKIDEDMNFDEEYSKFFGKKPDISPDEIVVQEHIFLRQLNRDERMRHEYAHMRNNMDIYVLKYAHQRGYNETLDDTIKLANKRAEMTDEVRERIHEEEERKHTLRLAIIKVTIAVILIPTIMMVFHRRMRANEAMMNDMVEMVREQDEYDVKRVQQSFVFDDEEKK